MLVWKWGGGVLSPIGLMNNREVLYLSKRVNNIETFVRGNPTSPRGTISPGVVFRGAIVNRDLRYTQKSIYLGISTNNIWSYLLWSPVIGGVEIAVTRYKGKGHDPTSLECHHRRRGCLLFPLRCLHVCTHMRCVRRQHGRKTVFTAGRVSMGGRWGITSSCPV